MKMTILSFVFLIVQCSFVNAQDYRSVGLTASYDNFDKSKDLNELIGQRYGLTKEGGQFQELLSSGLNNLFNKTFVGGSRVLIISDNSRFRAVKEISGSINSKSESRLIKSTIFDRNGNLIWRGKTQDGLILANNGQIFVTYDKNFCNTIQFYDVSKNKLSSEVPLTLKWGKFTHNSNFFICTDSRNLYHFSADGNLLSKFKARSDLHKIRMSTNGDYIVAGTRLNRVAIETNDVPEESLEPPFKLLNHYDRDNKQIKLPVKAGKAQSLDPLKGPATFTIIKGFNQENSSGLAPG